MSPVTEENVARAADRVKLSQPAASNALARARALIDDPLLVRASHRRLRRTLRAEAIREPLRAALNDLAAIVSKSPPDLAELRGAVRIVAADFLPVTLGARLMRLLAAQAPLVNLIFHPWHVGDEVERLQRGHLRSFWLELPCGG